jgi:hypothetical protein
MSNNFRGLSKRYSQNLEREPHEAAMDGMLRRESYWMSSKSGISAIFEKRNNARANEISK